MLEYMTPPPPVIHLPNEILENDSVLFTQAPGSGYKSMLNSAHVMSKPTNFPSNPTTPAQAPTLLPETLSDLAMSPEDKLLLDEVWQWILDIKMESCTLCYEEWFDLKVLNGICAKCRKSTKFQPSNQMYPGPAVSTLPELTQMEEMLISPIHALVQLWQVHGGQFIYTLGTHAISLKNMLCSMQKFHCCLSIVKS